MNFKELAQKDINDIFFNIDEFAERVKIDGLECLVVFEPNDFNADKKAHVNGLEENLRSLFLKTADAEKFKVNNRITVDSNAFIIKSIAKNLGITELKLAVLNGVK